MKCFVIHDLSSRFLQVSSTGVCRKRHLFCEDGCLCIRDHFATADIRTQWCRLNERKPPQVPQRVGTFNSIFPCIYNYTIFEVSTVINIHLFQAMPLIETLKLDELVDPRLGDSYGTYELYQMARVAYLCMQNKSAMRPTVREVNII